MTSTTSTNRASDMWNNSAQINSQSARQPHYGYQYPMVPNAYHYHNNFYSQNCDYSNENYNKSHGVNNSCHKVVKTEPNWQNYPINYINNSDQANMDMVNKWREMNMYAQQHENYGYQPGMQPIVNKPAIDIKGEDVRSIDSPGHCSLPETSYGSPQSSSSAIKSASLEDGDSPNLRALLNKPNMKRTHTQYEKYIQDKFYTHEMSQRVDYSGSDIENWGKNNESAPPNEGNMQQFHGEYNVNLDSHTKIKTKRLVGGASVQSESVKSIEEGSENCQDLTRVEPGGDNEDYADNKMAVASEVQGFYPWMKSVGGM